MMLECELGGMLGISFNLPQYTLPRYPYEPGILLLKDHIHCWKAVLSECIADRCAESCVQMSEDHSSSGESATLCGCKSYGKDDLKVVKPMLRIVLGETMSLQTIREPSNTFKTPQ